MKLGIIAILSVAVLSLLVVAGFAAYNGTTMNQNKTGMNGGFQGMNQNGMMNMNMDQMHENMEQMMNGTSTQPVQNGHGCH